VTGYKNISKDHDLVCTDVPQQWTIPLPCANDVTVSIIDCCRNHDIDQWCGPPDLGLVGEALTPLQLAVAQGWLLAVNLKLAGCIYAKILNGAESGSVPWYCGGILTETIIGVAVATFVSAVYLIAVEVAGELLMGSPQIPLLGQNKDSCLCGGTKPTVGSYNQYDPGSYPDQTVPCRDMCQELGKNEDCFYCHWQCDFSVDPPTVSWVSDTTGAQQCCPGSARECSCQCTPPKCECSKCQWQCMEASDGDNPDYQWQLWQTNWNAPCCDASIYAVHKENDPCTWEDWDNTYEWP
jgi:hypothetical protein